MWRLTAENALCRNISCDVARRVEVARSKGSGTAPPAAAPLSPAGGGDPAAPAPLIDDPRTLRALAHPVRLALLDLLIVHGPSTASSAGRLLGLEPNAVSFHLRQLARYGFVAEAGGGRGRERPWRIERHSFSWSDAAETRDLQLASEALSRVTYRRRIDQIREWLERRSEEPRRWREAAGATFSTLFLTPSELDQVSERLKQIGLDYVDRLDPANRPSGSRPVALQTYSFPLPDAPLVRPTSAPVERARRRRTSRSQP